MSNNEIPLYVELYAVEMVKTSANKFIPHLCEVQYLTGKENVIFCSEKMEDAFKEVDELVKLNINNERVQLICTSVKELLSDIKGIVNEIKEHTKDSLINHQRINEILRRIPNRTESYNYIGMNIILLIQSSSLGELKTSINSCQSRVQQELALLKKGTFDEIAYSKNLYENALTLIWEDKDYENNLMADEAFKNFLVMKGGEFSTAVRSEIAKRLTERKICIYIKNVKEDNNTWYKGQTFSLLFLSCRFTESDDKQGTAKFNDGQNEIISLSPTNYTSCISSINRSGKDKNLYLLLVRTKKNVFQKDKLEIICVYS